MTVRWIRQKPILYLQSRHPRELSGIVGNHDHAERSGLGGDQQVIVADRLTSQVQMQANSGIVPVNRFFKRQDIQG